MIGGQAVRQLLDRGVEQSTTSTRTTTAISSTRRMVVAADQHASAKERPARRVLREPLLGADRKSQAVSRVESWPAR